MKYPNFVPFRTTVGCVIITCFDLINSVDFKLKHNKQDHADEGSIFLMKRRQKNLTHSDGTFENGNPNEDSNPEDPIESTLKQKLHCLYF